MAALGSWNGSQGGGHFQVTCLSGSQGEGDFRSTHSVRETGTEGADSGVFVGLVHVIPSVRWPNLASKNTGCPVNIEFLINNE